MGFAIAWDQYISRDHAGPGFQSGQLQIRRLPESNNPDLRGRGRTGFISLLFRRVMCFRIGSTRFRCEAPEFADASDQAEEPEFDRDVDRSKDLHG